MILAACLVVTFDVGGFVGARADMVRAIRAADGCVVIDGDCLSSCTMFLALGDAVCVTDRARLFFHGPRGAFGEPLPPHLFDHWSGVMAQHYPGPIGPWFLAKGRFGESWVDAGELMRLGVAPCTWA